MLVSNLALPRLVTNVGAIILETLRLHTRLPKSELHGNVKGSVADDDPNFIEIPTPPPLDTLAADQDTSLAPSATTPVPMAADEAPSLVAQHVAH